MSTPLKLATAAEAEQPVPPSPEIAELRRALRGTQDELARALETQRMLREAADAARRVSTAETERRMKAEEDRAERIREVEQLSARCIQAEAERARLAKQLDQLQGLILEWEVSLGGTATRLFRDLKERIFPPQSHRRFAYDRTLVAVKERLSRIRPGERA